MDYGLLGRRFSWRVQHTWRGFSIGMAITTLYFRSPASPNTTWTRSNVYRLPHQRRVPYALSLMGEDLAPLWRPQLVYRTIPYHIAWVGGTWVYPICLIQKPINITKFKKDKNTLFYFSSKSAREVCPPISHRDFVSLQSFSKNKRLFHFKRQIHPFYPGGV